MRWRSTAQGGTRRRSTCSPPHANANPTIATCCPGLAYFTAQAGNRELALGYVKELRELDPENAQYARMASQIESTPPR